MYTYALTILLHIYHSLIDMRRLNILQHIWSLLKNSWCPHMQWTIGVFRVDVSVAIQLPFRGVIQIVNLGARNVWNAKRPWIVETPSEVLHRVNHTLKIKWHDSCCRYTYTLQLLSTVNLSSGFCIVEEPINPWSPLLFFPPYIRTMSERKKQKAVAKQPKPPLWDSSKRLKKPSKKKEQDGVESSSSDNHDVTEGSKDDVKLE